MKFYLRLLPYLRRYWHLALVAALATTLIALLGLLLPWPMTILVDTVLGDRPLPPVLSPFLGALVDSKGGLLAFVLGAELILALAINSMNVVNEFVQTRMTQLMGVHFRGDIYAHAQRMSLGYHARRLPGQLIYAINVEADIVVEFILVSLPMAQSALTIIGMVWILFMINPELALISLIAVPLLHYTVKSYARYIPTWLTKANSFAFLLVQMIHESIAMLPVITAFGREEYEHRRYREQGRRSIDIHLALSIRQTLFALLVNMITTLGTVLVLGFGAYQVLKGQLTVGQLLVVLAYIAAAYKPLETISTTIGSLQNLFVIMQRIFDVLDTAPEIEDQAGALAIARARGHVRYEQVRFQHHGRAATLQAISLEAAPGQLIAIVGPTGAGKTTLLNLLPRFYDPQDGRILLDGHDIRTLTLASLREQISIVAQEPLLFSGTIAENIRYGRLEASEEELIAAAKAAAAHEFIMRLPAQYNTLVGERGAQLSGGERQRLCIARAFLKNAPILILDEPTAAVDTHTEQSILAALERLMVGRTTLMVAHRLSTIRHADQIVVVQDGRVTEQGTHAELLARHGLYHQLSFASSLPRDDQAKHTLLPEPTTPTPTPIAPQSDTPPAVVRRPKIVVLGMMSKMPVAGIVWLTMQHILGLERLGYDVYYVEAHARTPSMFVIGAGDDGSSGAAAYLERVMRHFDMVDRWAFQALHADGRCYGMSETALNELYRSAALIINMHGGTQPRPEHVANNRLVYLGTDPVETEIQLYREDPQTIAFLEPHCAFFTWGENYGNSDCGVPVSKQFTFWPTRQPVLLDLWEPYTHGDARSFTTIGNWRQQWREISFRGQVYTWSKHHEFMKFLDLPRHTDQRFELALSSYEDADKRMLESYGWHVEHSLGFSTDIDSYRHYISQSRGEFTVAKDQNVRLRSGWFSDRSATYLAAGRPVVTQETGFSNILPTGRGLFGFSTTKEILESIAHINADYNAHRRGALALAREYFSYDVVLPRLLARIGLSAHVTPSLGGAAFPGSHNEGQPQLAGVATIVASGHEQQRSPFEDVVLRPISRCPTQLPEETVRSVLAAPVARPRANNVPDQGSAQPLVSIVIVTFNNLVYTRLCLESILAFTEYASFEMIVVDNGSTDGTVAYLREMMRQHPCIRPIFNAQNRGFAAANNQGLACAAGDVLMLLNNDTIVTPGWLTRMVHHLEDRAVGLLGPVTNHTCNEAQLSSVPYTTYAELMLFARYRAQVADGTLYDIRMLAMFCVAMRRDVYEQLGALDEQFAVGMFEDDDYALRVRARGYRVVYADDVFVHHFGQASFGELVPTGEYSRLFRANRQRFEAKWGMPWEPHQHQLDPQYQQVMHRIRELVNQTVPPHAVVIVVSRGDDELLQLGGRTAWHYPQLENGVYAGYYPAESSEAITHLEALRTRGASFLILPQTARWWLDYYTEFYEHLRQKYWCVADAIDSCMIFALSPTVGQIECDGRI